MACSKWIISIDVFRSRAAIKAASLQTLAMSAPAKQTNHDCLKIHVGYVCTCQPNKSRLPQDTRWLCLHLPTKQITTASWYTLAMSAPANQTNHNCLMIHVGYVHTCQTNKSWRPHDTRWLCLHLPTKQIMTASWYTLAMSAPANQITTAPLYMLAMSMLTM